MDKIKNGAAAGSSDGSKDMKNLRSLNSKLVKEAEERQREMEHLRYQLKTTKMRLLAAIRENNALQMELERIVEQRDSSVRKKAERRKRWNKLPKVQLQEDIYTEEECKLSRFLGFKRLSIERYLGPYFGLSPCRQLSNEIGSIGCAEILLIRESSVGAYMMNDNWMYELLDPPQVGMDLYITFRYSGCWAHVKNQGRRRYDGELQKTCKF